MGNGTPLACSKLGGVARYLHLYLLSFYFQSSVISCLGKLSYKIVGCIKVFHSFMSESCIRGCAIVYDEILMRSFLFALLHLVFFPRNQSYMLILWGVLVLYQVWLWKLYWILANIALVIATITNVEQRGVIHASLLFCFLLLVFLSSLCSYA